MNITALAETDIITRIKQNSEIQMSVLKDLVRDKNRKIRLLKAANITISILLVIAVVFSALILRMNANRNFGDEEKTVREMREVIEIAATTGDIQRGFDTNEITRKLDGLTNGLCDGFYAQNTNLLNGFASANGSVANEVRAIQSQMANCCCETNRNIDSVRFDLANYNAQINANTTAQTQKVLDAISQNRFEAMQNRINQLELNNALCGVVRYPNAMAYSAGTSPFCSCGNAYYA